MNKKRRNTTNIFTTKNSKIKLKSKLKETCPNKWARVESKRKIQSKGKKHVNYNPQKIPNR